MHDPQHTMHYPNYKIFILMILTATNNSILSFTHLTRFTFLPQEKKYIKCNCDQIPVQYINYFFWSLTHTSLPYQPQRCLPASFVSCQTGSLFVRTPSIYQSLLVLSAVLHELAVNKNK